MLTGVAAPSTTTPAPSEPALPFSPFPRPFFVKPLAARIGVMPDWRVLERHDRIALGRAGDAKTLDLTVRMAWEELDPALDSKEIRRMAFRQLKRIIEGWDEENWLLHSQMITPIAKERKDVEVPFHMADRESRPERPKLQWQRPELNDSDLKACHQLLEGLLLLGVHGRAVSTGDLVKKGKIGARALYRIINPESEAYAYLKPYIQDMKSRGRRLLDLTPEGRLLASQIRVGAITV